MPPGDSNRQKYVNSFQRNDSPPDQFRRTLFARNQSFPYKGRLRSRNAPRSATNYPSCPRSKGALHTTFGGFETQDEPHDQQYLKRALQSGSRRFELHSIIGSLCTSPFLSFISSLSLCEDCKSPGIRRGCPIEGGQRGLTKPRLPTNTSAQCKFLHARHLGVRGAVKVAIRRPRGIQRSALASFEWPTVPSGTFTTFFTAAIPSLSCKSPMASRRQETEPR